MAAFGPFYPSFLQESVNHAERLVRVLEALDPRSRRAGAATWLLGRVGELECLVAELVGDWKHQRLTEIDATLAVNRYIASLHRGLATYFGELAPPCCISSLVITAAPATFDAQTAVFPKSAPVLLTPTTGTWSEVDERDFVRTP